jgi:hypothetical protein
MPVQPIGPGHEVAIMPNRTSRPADVLEIAKVHRVGAVFIQLIDGRMFATIGGRGLNTGGYLVPLTDSHRDAMLAKAGKST